MKDGKPLLDSSVWIEILASGPLHKVCRRELTSSPGVVVPTLVIFEVYRKIASALSEDQALSAVAYLNRWSVVPMDQEVALTAADLSIEHRLGMADSIVLAHSIREHARLVTLDNDFAGIPGVKIIR